MVRDATHGVVGDTGWFGAANPGWIREKRVETAVAALEDYVSGGGRSKKEKRGAYIVEIDVDTTIVGEDEVANCVCALDGLRIIVECAQEPRIFGSNELSRLVIRPELDQILSQRPSSSLLRRRPIDH